MKTLQQKIARNTRNSARRKRAQIIARDGCTCYLCQKNLEPKQITLDHVVPISHGGNSRHKNLRVACYKCNILKGNLTVREFKNKYSEIKTIIYE